MTPSADEMDVRRMSRRQVLRNLGIAGLAAWAAPLLTTAPVNASADQNPYLCCRGACDDQCTCGSGPCGACGQFGASWCYVYFDRYGRLGWSRATSRWASVCAEEMNCSEAQKCLKSTDCPRDSVCVTLNG